MLHQIKNDSFGAYVITNKFDLIFDNVYAHYSGIELTNIISQIYSSNMRFVWNDIDIQIGTLLC
jgi:hypothetical protein